MTPRLRTRTDLCGRPEAVNRLAQADAFLAAAELVVADPGGAAMAKDLDRLLARKDSSHYGVAFVSAAEAARMVVWAKRLVATASAAAEA